MPAQSGKAPPTPMADLLNAPHLSGAGFLQRALAAMRTHLGLQVAYISRFEGDEAVYREVDAPGLEAMIKPGDRRPLDDVYCRHILAGRLPELMPDTSAEPLAVQMPITAAVPIGAHVSVPLRLPDGEVYGMFCCLGPAADPTLNARDLATMRTFADLAAHEIAREGEQERSRHRRIHDVRRAIGTGRSCVFQPIWSLAGGHPIGFEALSRFSGEPPRGPDHWFAEAASLGLGSELELAAVETALDGLAVLPPPVYLALNVSPTTIMSADLHKLLAKRPLDRIVLELTEHEVVEEYEAVAAILQPLRRRGLRLAADDAGAGYNGLQQILRIKPDLIKLDRALIVDIHRDPAKRALAAALAAFSRDTGSRLIAEGVETEDELVMLRAVGVDSIQGYLLGRPMPLADAVELTGGTAPQALRA